MTISTNKTQIHKCPECGFKTKLGRVYKKQGKKLIHIGNSRYCQSADCDWSHSEIEQISHEYYLINNK